MAEQAYYQTPGHVLAVAILLPILDIVAVALRFYARRKRRLPLGPDDWLTLPATVLVIGAGATLVTGVALRAIAYPTPPLDGWNASGAMKSKFTIASQVQWAFYLMSIIGVGCVKLSFLFFYRRIFCTTKRHMTSWIIYGLMVVMMLWALGCWFALIFACGTEVNRFWSSILDLVSCDDVDQYLFAGALSDMITDALIILFPIPLVWRLHMSLTRKLAVLAVFLLGSVAVAASTTRFVFINQVVQVAFDPTSDINLEITLSLYWAMLEFGLGLFAACLPTLHSLFKGLSRPFLNASDRSKYPSHELESWRSQSNGSQSRHYQPTFKPRSRPECIRKPPPVLMVPQHSYEKVGS